MNKKVIIIICISICFVMSICYSFIKRSKSEHEKGSSNSSVLYEGEPDIEFVCLSLNEFKDKINAGDIRSVNQDSLDNWEDKAKDLYTKWYDKGSIPSINKIDNTQLYSYNYTDEMVGISYVEDYEQSDYYYDVILLTEQLQKKRIKDIEEYYIKYDEKQDEILNTVGGTYNYINVNGNYIKAAIVDFEDGTKSVDFIWDNKYWIRMWDTESNLSEMLKNFSVNENSIVEPENFKDRDFKGEVERPENNKYVINELIDDIRTFDMTNSLGRQYDEIEALFKNDIPSLELSDEVNQYYELDTIEYINEEISYIQYNYKNNKDDSVISVAITPDIYDEKNVESFPEIYINKFNEVNPYRYNQEMAENYGVYLITSYDNTNYYELVRENLPDNVGLAFEYSHGDYSYTEYMVLLENRFIKVFCEETEQIEKLKSFINQIDVID